MSKHTLARIGLFTALIAQLLVLVVLFSAFSTSAEASAGQQAATQPRVERGPARDALQAATSTPLVEEAGTTQAGGGGAPQGAALQASTSLTVSILSSPWATLDNNEGQIPHGPRVFLVEAVVTNTGSTTATNMVVELGYDEGPANDWGLLNGEDPVRKVDLAPETAYHAYWFATYTTTWDIAHQYTVTADADNTEVVSTSHNSYGDPEPGKTVKTRKTLSTGNSGISQVSADIVVGVDFTVIITYDLGTDPSAIAFSPVGNLDFEPGAYRLLSSNVRFYNDANTLERTVHDRVYFDTLPDFADNATTSYTFIALTPANSRLCSHATVDYGTNPKYDQFYCEGSGVIPITGTLTFSLTKQASSPTIQQNQFVTYTMSYTNSGKLPLVEVWVWDDVDTSKASIISETIDPPSDPVESSGSRVAWYLGGVPASGQPGSMGRLTFTVRIDGDGNDLVDGTPVVDRAYMGIIAPREPAVTSTVATTVQAPTIAVTKTDGLETVSAGEALAYTLRITNSGSVTATGVVVTDHLPSGVSHPDGQVLVYNLDPIPPHGGSDVITVPGTVDPVPDGTVLTNTMTAEYWNEAGWLYDTASAIDTTTVASIYGIVFEDTNCNGDRDGGEPGIPGVTLTLDGSRTTTTGIQGTYSFSSTTTGEHTVFETDPVNYFSTTPNTVTLDMELGHGYEVNFGDVPDTAACGVVYGTVFEDEDHDGLQVGEVGLKGVTVALGHSGSAIYQDTTDQLGRYTLHFAISGPVTVTETNPPFYVSTTPDIIHMEVVTGSDNGSPYDFGDFLGIKVSGQVFEDADVDGDNDPGEGGLEGAVVSASVVSGVGEVFTTTTSGAFTLYATVSSTHPITIAEADPEGYLSTNAVPGHGMTRVDANTLKIAVPVSGTAYAGDFGDVEASSVVTISGYVWDDNGAGGGAAADGQWDNPLAGRPGSEPGLAGAVISLTSGLSQTTDSTGDFMLYAPPGQVITITETNPDGYASTNAVPGDPAVSKIDNDTLVVANTLTAGQTVRDNLFGDAATDDVAIITGTVFYDEDENGMLGSGEMGLQGVTVTLEISGGNTIAVPTGVDGQYQFAVAPGTDVRITSASPGPGYYPTTIASVFVRPASPGAQPPIDFGWSDDSDVAMILGIVFDDHDSDGEQDPGELGLAGAVITLTRETTPLATITTTGNGLVTGTFGFTVTRPSAGEVIYGVHEENPPGYRSTTPDDVNLPMAPTTGFQYVEFGDTDNPSTASIYGTAFDDTNCSGRQDPTEPGLAGVVITATCEIGGADGTTVLTTTTETFGQYTFGFNVPDSAYCTVSEQDPARPGYHSTTPDALALLAEGGSSYVVDFGDTPSACYAIMGTVYDDLTDGDGVQDLPWELGIAGVTVGLSTGQTTATGDYGQYTFPVSVAEYVQVTETDLPGYHSTTPNMVSVQMTDTQQMYVVNFGDRADSQPGVSFFGTVFEDQNVNTVWDQPHELGLGSISVTIVGTFDTAPDPYVTNELGQYTFLITNTGTFTVTETDPKGYVSTIAIPGHLSVVWVDNNTLSTEITATLPGRELGDNSFGDAQASEVITVSGYVWDDNGAGDGTAGDGVWDSPDNPHGPQPGSEPGLAGAVLGLSSGQTQTTGSDGAFLLYGPPDETITVSEDNPSGYVSTGATAGNDATKIDNDTLTVDPLSGGMTSKGNLFGDVLPADLEVVKSGNPDDVTAGTTLTYTLVFTNHGPSYAQSVYITDELPLEVAFGAVIDQPPSLSGPTQTNGLLTWFTPTLAAGASGTIVLAVSVDADAIEGTVLTNTASIASDMPDTVLVNDTATLTTPVTSEVDLAIAKRDDPDPVTAGTLLTYTLVVTNNGPSDGTGVTVADSLPGGVSYDSHAETQGTYYTATSLWLVGDLAVDASAALTLVVTVDSDATDILTNTAEVSGSQFDPISGNNKASIDTAVETEADLAVGKSDDPDPVVAGLTLTYTLEYTNFGPSDASGVYITDTLSDYATFGGVVSQQPLISGPSQAGQLLTWSTPAFAADAFGAIVYTVTVHSDAIVSITNGIAITSSTPDTIPDNNSAQEDTAITCLPDEYEPGDVATQASELGERRQEHNFCDDAVDWTTFTAEAGNTYTITTSSWGRRADTYLALFWSDGETLLAANDDYEGTTDYSSRIVWRARQDGVYYLRANNRAGLTGNLTDYNIWLEREEGTLIFVPIVFRSFGTPAEAQQYTTGDSTPTAETEPEQGEVIAPTGIITHTCPDAYESDNTWEQAKSIEPGIAQVHSFDSDPVRYAADKDFVSFDLKRRQIITFTVGPVNNTQTLLELWDESGAPLGVSGTVELAWQADTAGRYYLSVSPAPGTTTFGCEDEVGYVLQAERSYIHTLYLPVVMR
jgi:uncharacterized repeat protein (TIGR01451 family)